MPDGQPEPPLKSPRAAGAIAAGIAGIARRGAAALRWIWRILETVPPSVRGFGLAAVVMLLGIVGAITDHNTFGLVCIVVVIPVCASILGALAQRWYSGSGGAQSPIRYVDNKLALALTALGTERDQQAMVALFQAKTAAELTLGTEQESPSCDVALRADDYALSPRVRAGSNATSPLPEGNSLAS